jgi:hypothetical protein
MAKDLKELKELIKDADKLVIQMSDTAEQMIKCNMMLVTYLHRFATFLSKGDDDEQDLRRKPAAARQSNKGRKRSDH